MELNHVEPAPLSITAMTPETLVELLRKSGATSADLDRLKADLTHGAPQNADGTINFLHYTAWLLKEMQNAN